MRAVEELVGFVEEFYSRNLGCAKEVVAHATVSRFTLQKVRSLYVGPDFAIRFSMAGGGGLSNTILSLSALQPYDSSPLVVCVLRARGVEFLLANSTFLRKVSHSSLELRVDNVRGSFNGADIMRQFDDFENRPSNFGRLFAIHSEFSWEDNLVRLVEATNNIVATGHSFIVGESDRTTILAAADLAARLTLHPEYLNVEERLQAAVTARRAEILACGTIDNVNLRGNQIERLLTDAGHFHRIDDRVFRLDAGNVVVDIKTKVLALQSNPKGYNIDKYLRLLAQGQTVMSFFFVGLDLPSATVKSCLVSTLDQTILAATRVQHHWAGRNSRGVTQLAGYLPIFEPEFHETVDVASAKRVLLMFADSTPA